LSVDNHDTILDAIRRTGLHVASQCGGKGSCGKCQVFLHPAPDPKPLDLEHLSSTDVDDGYRLACQYTVVQDTRVLLPGQHRDVKILTEGDAFQSKWELDQGLDNQMGMAIDLGTTTIVVYLLNLGSGEQIGQTAGLNPQVTFGEDVISRIHYAVSEKRGDDNLSEIVSREFDGLINQLIEGVGLEKEKISRIVVVGNTAMNHLLLKADVKPLGVAPYEPTIRDAVNTTGEDLGLSSIPGADVYLPPNIAGFVGGDTIGFILSQRLDLTDSVILGIDVGTNGEIVLSNKGELSCCSTAAGSAFEGATIQHGMRGRSGAIEYLAIKNPDDPPEISVIGDERPQGLCGSGIVDVTAEMITAGILDSRGRLQTISKRVLDDDGGVMRYLITNNKESGSERDIVFTQKDVRHVQLAKGAIFAGSTILLKQSRLDVQDIDIVMLAGAFGSYIRPESALTIGLFPQVDADKVIQVGNAAGEGAKTLLLSSQSREHVEDLVRQIQYLELAYHDDFQPIFIDSLKFP
jgi:uncharacterized 2Fe-2S/4Fe-4S cluster protein (DUF4445 family)